MAVLFITLFALPRNAQAQTEYDLAIAGKTVTSENCNELSVITGVSGTVSYDPKTKTLTLQDATIDGEMMYAISSDIYGLKINVVGTNSINAKVYGIIFSRPTTIMGEGTLNVAATTDSGICASGTDLTIDGCTVNAKGVNSGIKGYDGNHGENLVIKNATITAEGENEGSIGNIAAFTMEGCSITEPVGAAFDEPLHGVAQGGKLVSGKVVIAPSAVPVTEYDLMIAGTKANEKNCGDLSVIDGVSGIVKYDPESKTLTLENAAIDAGEANAIFSEIDDLTIKVLGTNNIKASITTVNFLKPTTLTGGGTLNVESTYDCAVYVYSTSLTIDGCTVNAKGVDYGIAGSGEGQGDKFIVKNATVTAEGTKKASICDFAAFTMEGCAITEPVGAAFDKSLKGVALKGELVKSKVTIAPVTLYILAIAGTQVSTANCGDLSVIDGVEGKANYDDATKTLTLDNARITISKENHYGIGSGIDGLTIKLIGTNTITSEKGPGMYNRNDCALVFAGSGTLTVNGSTTSSKAINCKGISNRGTVTVKDCTLEVSGGVDGLAAGYWKFDNCNMRVKGNGSETDLYNGSFGYMWGKKPEFVGCQITAPQGTYWKDFVIDGNTYYSLFGADNKAVTDWVTITNNATGIGTPVANAATVKQGIYTLSGVRLSGELNKLPKGVYIVDGKKVVKQ